MADQQSGGVNIPFDGGQIQGFLSGPASGKAPAVIVIHEWWGLNDHVRDVTGRLGAAGFLALAPDLFDGRTTTDAGAAGQMMMNLNQGKAVGKLRAAVTSLLDDSRAAGTRAGVIGFCMGGSYSLLLPIHDERVGAATPFYGQVPGDDVLKGLKAPTMYVYAGKDQWITRDEVDRLDSYLNNTGNPGGVVRYMDADHAFFNDTRPEVYRKDDADDAWNRAEGFLREHLAG